MYKEQVMFCHLVFFIVARYKINKLYICFMYISAVRPEQVFTADPFSVTTPISLLSRTVHVRRWNKTHS